MDKLYGVVAEGKFYTYPTLEKAIAAGEDCSLGLSTSRLVYVVEVVGVVRPVPKLTMWPF